jgi:hypothetical protein
VSLLEFQATLGQRQVGTVVAGAQSLLALGEGVVSKREFKMSLPDTGSLFHKNMGLVISSH